jgi:hypothetical protein
MFAAETVHNLIQERGWAAREEWGETVDGLIRRHNTYVCHNGAFDPKQYSKSFNERINDHQGEGVCDNAKILRSG